MGKINYTSIKLLVRKDLYLARWILLSILIAYPIVVSQFIINTTSWLSFARSSMQTWILFSTLHVGASFVLAIGYAVAMQTVVRERIEKVDVLVLSMPITLKEYYFSKLLVNGSVVCVAWFLMFVGMIMTILFRADVPNGLIPVVTLINVQSLAGLILLLAVALVVRTQISLSLVWIAEFIYFLYFLGGFYDKLGVTFDVIRQDAITWPLPLVAMLLGTILLIGLIVFITRSLVRKRDFI